MSRKFPLVSVVMPVYNGERYLRQAIESILLQTFHDFEFIIINDGSHDTTESIVRGYTDPRIRLFSQSNRGLVYSLNRGIAAASGLYIARMDADDVSAHTRIGKALEVFKERPATAIVGTGIVRIDETGKEHGTEYYLANDTELREELALYSPFAHGSVVMRKDLVHQVGGYRPEFWPAEDYDLWRRLAAVGELANILEPLYFYRVNPEGVTGGHMERMNELAMSIAREVFNTAVLRPDMPLRSCLASYALAPPQAKQAATSRILQTYFHVSVAHLRRGSTLRAGRRLARLILASPEGFHLALGKLRSKFAARMPFNRSKPL